MEYKGIDSAHTSRKNGMIKDKSVIVFGEKIKIKKIYCCLHSGFSAAPAAPLVRAGASKKIERD